MQYFLQQMIFFNLTFSLSDKHTRIHGALSETFVCVLAFLNILQHTLHLNFGSVHNTWHLIKRIFVCIPSLDLRTIWQQLASDCTRTHRLIEPRTPSHFLVHAALSHTGFYMWIKKNNNNKKHSYPVAHGGERASLLFARQRYIFHTGMLHATFILADIRAPELLPRGVVQRGGHCRWGWSQTAFWAGGGSSPFSILSPPAPILGLATVPLTCQKLRSQNRCWDLGCKSLLLRTGPSAKPL